MSKAAKLTPEELQGKIRQFLMDTARLNYIKLITQAYLDTPPQRVFIGRDGYVIFADNNEPPEKVKELCKQLKDYERSNYKDLLEHKLL